MQEIFETQTEVAFVNQVWAMVNVDNDEIKKKVSEIQQKLKQAHENV